MNRFALGAMLAAFGACALAQTPPLGLPPADDAGAIQQRSIDLQRRRLERETRPTEQRPLDREQARPAPARPSDSAVRFRVTRIDFTDSAILSAAELRQVAADFEGRELTIDELQGILQKVNDLYKSKGVVTAQAVLPPQEIVAGVVRVRLVEGRVGKVSVKGNETTRERYVTDRVSLKPAELVDLNRLERDMIRFNRSNDAQVRADLLPGGEFGQTDVALELKEPPRHALQAFADNSGSQNTGTLRYGLVYLNRSVLGYRDSLAFTLTGARGHGGFSLLYGIPVTPLGTRLSAGFYDDKTRIISGDFPNLRVTGRSTAYTLQLRHPMLFGAAYQVDGTLGTKRRRTNSWIDSVLLQSTVTRDVSVGVEAQVVDGDSYWLGALNGYSGKEYVGDLPRDRYTLFRANLRHHRPISPGWAFNAVASWQQSTEELLPASEQFMIGGEGTVRGYKMGLFSGDRGYVLNFELQHPLPGATAGSHGFFFLDHGVTRPFRPIGSQQGEDQISSAGWGWNAAVTKSFTMRLVLAQALKPRREEPYGRYAHVQLILNMF